jgi:hypothetical protein
MAVTAAPSRQVLLSVALKQGNKRATGGQNQNLVEYFGFHGLLHGNDNLIGANHVQSAARRRLNCAGIIAQLINFSSKRLISVS